MDTIRVNGVSVKNNSCRIEFDCDGELSKYFNQKEFLLEYWMNEEPLSLEEVPESVLLIPFVCNVLPIAWLTDSKIDVPSLDRDFYDSIDQFKKGYVRMYPDCNFAGRVQVSRIEDNSARQGQKSAVFFSGGWIRITPWFGMWKKIPF